MSKRQWKMRAVVGFESEDSPKVPGVERLFTLLECGHRYQHGNWFPGSGLKLRRDGPGWKSNGDKARCYSCPKSSAPGRGEAEGE